MGGCQKYGPFLGTLKIRCRKNIGIHKGTIILTTTHVAMTMESRPSSENIFLFAEGGRLEAAVWLQEFCLSKQHTVRLKFPQW